MVLLDTHSRENSVDHKMMENDNAHGQKTQDFQR